MLMHRRAEMSARKPNWGKTPWEITFRAKAAPLPKAVDFAIVGGGFTGLAAAAWLARMAPRKSVLVLEAGRLGNGASGRTGGMALAETAAGKLPGLGDVLSGYRKILRELGVAADVDLRGVWEIARGERSMEGKAVRPLKNSPIDWSDSGWVRAVEKVAGGTVDPGKVISGLAKAAVKSGAQIVEEAEVLKMEFGNPIRLHVGRKVNGSDRVKIVSASQVLLATNAGSLELAGELYARGDSAEPKLTFAVATAPLTKKQLAAIGIGSGRPFYSVDLPYLWGRRMKNGGMIFGSGLVPGFAESIRENAAGRNTERTRVKKVWSGLEQLDVRRSEPAERLKSLEQRVRGLHPALTNMRVTHRWGGPILLTKDFVPTFRRHPKNKNVIVLGGYSGHGVALSVYLGKWTAEALLEKKSVPKWAAL
jgi:glycine/D-amino acid oxidase-like deaminating enzyme